MPEPEGSPPAAAKPAARRHDWRRHHPLTWPLHRFAWGQDNRRRTRLAMALGVTVLALGWPLDLGWKLSLLGGWIAGCGGYLTLVYLVAVNADADATQRRVPPEPHPMATLATVVLCALGSNMFFGFLINSHRSHLSTHEHLVLTLSAIAILLCWALMHTSFGRYYCQIYYAARDRDGIPARGGKRGGFSFPGTPEPSQLDFFYASFMVALTYCTSDVAITNRHVRKLVLAHALLSFVFYTTVATSIVNLMMNGGA